MATKLSNLVGKRFNCLTILREGPRLQRRRDWVCRCDCGEETIISTAGLRYGRRSCGCFIFRNRRKHGETHNQHSGLKRYTPEYHIWLGIKKRCYNKKEIEYKNYGARGIKVCNRWINDYSAFLADMGRKPTPEHTLDRIDGDGDYEPDNCRWATRKEQRQNMKDIIWVTLNGKTLCVADWCKELKLNEKTVRGRLYRGWDSVRALTEPIKFRRSPEEMIKARMRK